MAYRNKTFVSFASEDIRYYRLMTAWSINRRIDFNFHNAHDMNVARDSSQPETIYRRLRERLNNTKQIVMLIGDVTRRKAAMPGTFLYYESKVIETLDIPVVFANLNKSRKSQNHLIPQNLLDLYTVSVAFGPRAIKFALDYFPDDYYDHRRTRSGPYEYSDSIYYENGL